MRFHYCELYFIKAPRHIQFRVSHWCTAYCYLVQNIDRNEGTQAAQNTIHHPPISTWWKVSNPNYSYPFVRLLTKWVSIHASSSQSHQCFSTVMKIGESTSLLWRTHGRDRSAGTEQFTNHHITTMQQKLFS